MKSRKINVHKMKKSVVIHFHSRVATPVFRVDTRVTSVTGNRAAHRAARTESTSFHCAPRNKFWIRVDESFAWLAPSWLAHWLTGYPRPPGCCCPLPGKLRSTEAWTNMHRMLGAHQHL